jgi:fluoride exporter
MTIYICIALGSGIGGAARYGMAEWMASRFGDAFPWGTIAVNITGCFIIGLFASITGPEGKITVDAPMRHFFMTGVLGGFTTFSSLSLQTLHLAREGHWQHATANALGSLIACLAAVWLGYLIGQSIPALRSH